MKMTLVRTVLLLVLGTILNFAVAWGCAIRSSYFIHGPAKSSRREEFTATWARLAWPGWNAEPTRGSQRDDFGATIRRADAGRWNSPQNPSASLSRYLTYEQCAGWPMLGLRGKAGLENGQNAGWVRDGFWRIPWNIGKFSCEVPIKPIWPGLAINTLFYATALWGLFACPFALRRALRRRRGRCANCGYPRGVSEVCTECGAVFPPARRSESRE